MPKWILLTKKQVFSAASYIVMVRMIKYSKGRKGKQSRLAFKHAHVRNSILKLPRPTGLCYGPLFVTEFCCGPRDEMKFTS